MPARSPRARSAPSRSRRAASSAWIVGRHRDRPEIARRHPIAVRAFEQAVVDEHREHLLDEERVALGRIGDPSMDVVGELRSAEEVLRSARRTRRRSSGSSRTEVALNLPPPQLGPVVEELGSREANEQNRRVPRPVGDVLDEIEECRLAPLEVVEDDDERPLARLRLEQLAHGPEGLLGRPGALDEADRRRDSLCDQLCILLPARRCGIAETSPRRRARGRSPAAART